VFRSLLSTLEELTLLVLPHGGQRTARRNAWRAATDLHVTSGYRWTDGSGLATASPLVALAPHPAGPADRVLPAIPAPTRPRQVALHR
jgi:hypothetical protein